MKPLNKMDHIERAELLYNQYPQEVKAFIGFVEDFINYAIDKPEKFRHTWRDEIIQFELFRRVAVQVKKAIELYGHQLEESAQTFSRELFSDQLAWVTIYCLHQYKKIVPNEAFALAVNELFNYK